MPSYQAFVDAWLARGRDQPGSTSRALLEEALRAVWARTRTSLGERTARSVFTRALEEAAEVRPGLRSAFIDERGLATQTLAGRPDEEIADDLTFALGRILDLLRLLTGDVLTPVLLGDLERLVSTAPKPAGEAGEVTSDRISLGEPNLDSILLGGLPKRSLTIVAGGPGAGKTILAQQVAFANASAWAPVIVFSTLGEPPAKLMRYLRQFRFFDPAKLEAAIELVDLAGAVREGLDRTLAVIVETVTKTKPHLIVIDSFKIIEALAPSEREFHHFVYQLGVDLMSWDATTLLVGEYRADELDSRVVFSLVDGVITLTNLVPAPRPERCLRVVKMRGVAHLREAYPFFIDESGIRMYGVTRVPRVAFSARADRLQTGIPGLDTVLGGGIPIGASVLVAGQSGSGRTVLGLEFLIKGIRSFGGRGLFVALGETEDGVRRAAKSLAPNADELFDGDVPAIRILALPPSERTAEATLARIDAALEHTGANRVVIDSLSTLLANVSASGSVVYAAAQLASSIAAHRATALLTASIPPGFDPASAAEQDPARMLHGLIVLTNVAERLERVRYLEVLKLTASEHLKGLHLFAIGREGMRIYPRYLPDLGRTIEPMLDPARRVSSGVDGVDAILGGGLLEHSVTFLCGNPGIGKTTFALQFLNAGCEAGERGIFVSLAERPEHPVELAASLDIPFAGALERGEVRLVDVPRLHPLGAELISILDRNIREHGARRVVIDGATHITAMGWTAEETEKVFYELVVRCKELGATTVFNLESASLWGTTELTHVQVAALADNYVMMEYTLRRSRLERSLYVVKARCTGFDNRIFGFTIERHGIRVVEALEPTRLGTESVEQVGDRDAAPHH